MVGQVLEARRVRLRALQTTAIGLALVLGAPAFAQCAPEPTQPNTTTTCTGVDADGVTVTTYGTPVSVATGATVLGAGGPAIAVRLPSQSSGSPVTLAVAGRVDGGAQAGVSLLWQSPATGYGYTSSNLGMTIVQGGAVSGANAVVVGQSGTGYGNAYVTVDNAGALTGTSGIALLSTAPGYSGFSSITNRATGRIGAISGSVGALSNAGTIDGGTRSAIDWGTSYGSVFGDITNSGTITTSSTAATLANLPSGRALTNSGIIANSGTGAAIAGDILMITNAAGGRISSTGATAIRANTFLTLTNAGTITGNVLTAASPAYATGSRVDSSAGTITGGLTFGGGNDTLVASYNGTGLVTGITGVIDGGAGTDTVRVRFATDATVTQALTLPTSFEQMSLAPDAKTTAILSTGFSAPGPIQIVGSGTVINRTILSGSRQAVLATSFSSGQEYATFINDGTVLTTAGVTDLYAISLDFNVNRFENTGTVSATGGGVSFRSQGAFVNSGMITAAGTGVSLFGPSFANSGTVRSTAGTGVILSDSSGANWTNSGRIEGTVAGARISSSLTNSGIITSAGTGVALESYGSLNNLSGGVVTGGAAGVGGTNFLSNATIANAGTINGNVRLAGTSSSSYNGNRYFALIGGVLNGNLTLGSADTLIAELANSGSGRFAGITGTVQGSGSLLRYRARGTVSARLGLPTGFAGVGYDLYDDATLTLTGTSTGPITLAGTGNVDLTADITTSSQPAISTGSVLLAPGETAPATGAISITSRGAMVLDHSDSSTYPYALVALGSGDSFTNAGTIIVRERATTIYNQVNAISGGKSVTNDGTIALDGAVGVIGAQALANSGSIIQAAGGRAATGVRSTGTLNNIGTIDVAGNAVLVDYNGRTITNSGRIASSGAAAITVDTYGSSYGLKLANLTGGTIAGGSGQLAVQLSGGTLDNAGTITGSVDLGYSTYGRSYNSATYLANGGTIAGDLSFGSGNDTLIAFDGVTGVSGTIDGGDGEDLFVHARDTSGAITLGVLEVENFELQGVRALGSDTLVTVSADAPVASDVYVSGGGRIVSSASISGAVRTGVYGYSFDPTLDLVLASFGNQGTILGGFFGTTRSFTNTGTVGSAAFVGNAVQITGSNGLTFANSGQIAGDGSYAAVYLNTPQGEIAASNSGSIAGGFTASVGSYYGSSGDTAALPAVSLTSSGTITNATTAVALEIVDGDGKGGAVSLVNSGTIEATGPRGTAASLNLYSYQAPTGPATISVTNSGTLRANGGGTEEVVRYWDGQTFRYTRAASALVLSADSGTATVANTATGLIETTGDRSTAIVVANSGLELTNAGTIRGGTSTLLADDDQLIGYVGSTYLASAIQTVGGADDRIVNTGAIIGSIALGAGNDRIDNRGTINGDVRLGMGDDTFLQLASATLVGTVDGGEGTDSLVIDATGGGAVNGDQFIDFERFSQIGEGNVTYSGNFRFNTIGVSGGAVSVGPGQTLSSGGAVTLTGSDIAETVINDGTIAGSVELAGGNDRLFNNGAILGSVSLGSGDDQFVEGAGSRVAGAVDGGDGNDLYTVMLAGNRSGIGQRAGFERLSVEGSGTLSLALDQDFATLSLAGTNLNLSLAGHRVGSVTGSDAAEMLAVDGDFVSVALGGSDDQLSLGTTRAAGRYDGGIGSDVLRFTAAGPVTLAGTATGFEQVALAGNALTVTGTLGSAGVPLSFGAGDQQLTLGIGGTLAGVIDLGAGNDGFRLVVGSTLNGTVSGGAGTDTATLELAGDRTLAGGILSSFETLVAEGNGTLSLAGTQAYDRVTVSSDLAVLAGASLTAPIQFGAGNNRLTIAGKYAGSVDGGAGVDTISVSGGSAAAPVSFGSINNVESLAMTGGYATISGSAAFDNVDVSSGRLIGLAGSVIGAPQIIVRQGGTFGSAGTVNGNITVAGTLSPGASPGIMTVNGNVALQTGSVSLFELTSTISDQLLVNGAVTIASGSTLQIVPSGTLRPGTSYDLIVASGGITGSYTTVIKPDSLFGFVVQRADRIQLLGQFLDSASFNPQVNRSIAYANATLVAQPATSTLFAAVPALLTSSGASNPQAFAQLTPEAYASATQIGVDNALTLAGAARGPTFATSGDDVHVYTSAQTLGGWHRLGSDSNAGTSAARSRSYGFLGGIGVGDASWSVGAFAGYLNERQRIDALGARTKADGVVAGVHGRYQAENGFGLTASILYDGGEALTERALPAGTAASSRYGLHSWVSDVSVSYGLSIAADWTLRPHAGVTYVRTTRDKAAEKGGSAFALSVSRDRHVAGFADTGLFLGRSETSQEAFRPFVSLGARYEIEGARTDALAGYSGGGLGLSALGPRRASVVGSAAAGVGYRLPSGLDLFAAATSQTGSDDHQETITAGVKMRF